jgi:type IV pilus assembly protein PilA
MARRLLQAQLRMSNGASLTSRGACASAGALRSSRLARRAFTLIELMIVVTIVGVLAVIAVVGYRKLVLSAKLTEARNVISGVRIAQESYRTERGVYANLGTALCPLANSGTLQVKTAWDTGCGAVPTWAVLPIHIDGPVQFGYSTVAGSTTLPVTIGQPVAFVSVPGGVGTDPWYYVTASADLDGSGGLFTELVGTSWQNTIFVANEGE